MRPLRHREGEGLARNHGWLGVDERRNWNSGPQSLCPVLALTQTSTSLMAEFHISANRLKAGDEISFLNAGLLLLLKKSMLENLRVERGL